MDYRPIIEARYNRTSWQALINDIFGTAATLLQTAAPVEVNNELAREAFYLGRITLPDGYQIAIYEVRLNDHVLVERNRVGIRNLLLSHWRDNGYVGAFMFCYRENDAVLRFSYVSETWQFGDDGNYAKTSTDTKRYTYLLGEGHRSRTAVERFEKLKDSQLTLKDLTKAFSVEALSDKFFDEYKQCYENIVAYVTGKRMVKEGSKWVERTVGTPNTTIMQQFNQFPNAEKAVRDYVKKLMGRLVFIQFLQKKGWMGVPQGDGWENGDREFLQHLYEKSNYKDSFVDNVLEPLFDNINTLRQGDLVTSPNVGQGIKVPYLNGGLFEQDDYDRIDFPLPARFIKSVLDFFAAYNFTIDENDPDDAEVGVDPEMLGRVFENLLEDNKDKGAFYTPKEIVQYMCRESLVAYLQTGITNEPTREAIRQFVTTHDAKHINGADSKLAQQVDRHLKDVKICDPAIGSGAFPMGLLRELYACRQAIEGISPEKAVEIKQHIIQQNIYGVDIEKGAVDIARLRFWLALIVDETTPAALPNLDFKIMQGNSLLEQYRGVDLSRVAAKESNITVVEPERDLWGNIEIKQLEINFQKTDTRKQLQELLEKYFYVSNHCDKQKLRNEIGNIIRAQIKASVDGLRKQCDRQLNELKGGEDCRKEEKKARELLTDKRGQYVEMLKELESIDFVNDQFFLWHTWFADVLNRPSPCNGFDIVIGNPPYGAKTSPADKALFKQVYESCKTTKDYKGSTDTFVAFIDHALNVLQNTGYLAYIVPMSVISSDAMCALHNRLQNECDTIQAASFSNRPKQVFDAACVRTSIIFCKKTLTPMCHSYTTKLLRRSKTSSVKDIIEHLSFADTLALKLRGRFAKAGSQTEVNILRKMFATGKTLADYIYNEGEPMFYRAAGGRYFNTITPYATHTSAEKYILIDKRYINSIACLYSSSLFWFYQQCYTDGLNLKRYEVEKFPLPNLNYLSEAVVCGIEELYAEYLADIEHNANVRQSSGTSSYNVACFKEYKIVKSKAIIDRIDDLICPLYGLTQEETDFIKNYELEFRMSGDD